jgi:hypothetical protein
MPSCVIGGVLARPLGDPPRIRPPPLKGMPRALLKLAKRSLPMIILRDFELLVKNSIV